MTDVLAIGPHPDDVELRIGATLAKFARLGFSTGIVHLTRGEMATRGNPQTRREEALCASEALGAQFVDLLDLGDGFVADSATARDAVMRILREQRPRLVLAPFPADDHPDHVAAGNLVEAAWYLSGIRKLGSAKAPHRPASLWFFPSHRFLMPSFVVEVSAEDFDNKMAAVRAYRSQFHDPDSNEPQTRISEPGFLEGVVARMRTCGEMIGSRYGEAFLVRTPLAIPDPGVLLR